MPDSVLPDEIRTALGLREVVASPAVPRDSGSVWTLNLPPVHLGARTIALIDSPAFGTGLHPTTVLCLAFLEDIAAADPPASVLDVGTGSGVLAIAALALGVARATAIDIDVAALDAAGENARRNGVDERLELRQGGPDEVAGTWPLVLANVLAAPLIEMAPQLVRRVAHHGRLVLSGIPAAVAPDVTRAYRRVGMTQVATRSRGAWVAQLLRASW